MSTTDQPTIDAQAPVADRGGWAVPGLDQVTAADAGAGWAVPGVDMTSPREHPDAGPDLGADQGADGDAAADADAPNADGAPGAGPETGPETGPGGGPGAGREAGSGVGRDSAAAAEAAVAGWRAELDAAANAGAGAGAGGAGGAGGGGHVHPVVVAVATCLEALDGVRESGVATLTAREVRLLLLAVVQVITAAVALKLRLVVAGHTTRVADLTGATCTAAFLAHLTRANRPEATSEVRLARDLDGRYRLLAAALARGTISPEQVKACVTGLRRLPRDLPAGQLQACEEFLIDAAQTMTPTQLKAVGRKLWEVIDPDGADAKDGQALDDEETLARAKAYFRSWRNGDGTTGFRGKLPDVQADILLKLLHAHAAPRRRNNPNIPTSQPDNTTHPTNNDSGGTGTGNSNDAGSGTGNSNGRDNGTVSGSETGTGGGSGAGGNGDDAPDGGTAAHAPSGHQAGEQPPADDPAGADQRSTGAAAGGESAGPDDRSDRRPPDPPPGGGDPDRASCDGTAADACLDEESAEEQTTGKTIPYPVRLGHALIDLLERIPATAIPDTAGTAASIVVTVTADQLATGLGVATLDTGTAISAGQTRRLACAAGIIPMVLDGPSEPLDLGREQRLHTRHQRLATAHRQHGRCGTDGCDRPITDYHHPHPWSTGGPTSLANCLGLCGYHHHLAHHPAWTLTHDNNTWTFQRKKS